MRLAVKACGLVLFGAALVAQACATGQTDDFEENIGGTTATTNSGSGGKTDYITTSRGIAIGRTRGRS